MSDFLTDREADETPDLEDAELPPVTYEPCDATDDGVHNCGYDEVCPSCGLRTPVEDTRDEAYERANEQWKEDHGGEL